MTDVMELIRSRFPDTRSEINIINVKIDAPNMEIIIDFSINTGKILCTNPPQPDISAWRMILVEQDIEDVPTYWEVYSLKEGKFHPSSWTPAKVVFD